MVDTLSILVTHFLLLIAFWRLAQRRAVDADPTNESVDPLGRTPHDP